MKEKNKASLKDQQLSLKDLIDIKQWQKIQDNFAAVTDVRLRTVDSKGNLITSASKEQRLCRGCVDLCLPTFLGGRGVVDKNLNFTCKTGLHSLVAPLKIEDKLWGYIVVGPVVLVMRKPKEQYRQVAEELNLSLESFWDALLEIKVISFQGVQSLVELIKDIGEYTINLAYQGMIEKRGVMMATDSSKLSRLLEALLDVAFQVTQADIGSIMLVDKSKNELNIRTSKGLPDAIVKRARVRLGEGISGIAASEGESFLIDDKINDNRIKRYLNRPNLHSSMVIPIKVEDKVWGVVNLGALRTSAVKFNQDNMNVLHKLINLATIAIHP